ncbi:MAG TPA: 23S rRNA (pseudouridine(1915)-N(3))-methyltransferase RlmH [Longimicrobiaceae bacterium]|nr:23S rRNA (pseudouridine(1915)-N(3))-methyltransferase RlmH [Longimicrobiaceae bacterium]
MKVGVVAVGRPKRAFAAVIADYESRAARYFSFEATEVKEQSARSGGTSQRVQEEEGQRLLARVVDGTQVVALHPDGVQWTSERLAAYLGQLGLDGAPGATFLIGGAYGLSREVLASAHHKLSLSALTMPHDIARLVLAEQLYRSGTILRNEPYHKG